MKNTLYLRSLFAAASVAVSLLFVPALKATPLLTAAYEAQLEAWLGQGNLNFTNVFTKQAGDDSFDFHAAADGQGATFTLMSISGTGGYGSFALPEQVIGGYNPQSWNSSSTYNITPTNAERTAFLYNLSSGALQRQNLIGEGQASSGQSQTYNFGISGPAFGDRFGLSAFGDLTKGQASNYSYGGTSFGNEIVSGGPNLSSSYSTFDVGELEVWTFSSATNSVPDTAGTLGLLSVSLLALAACRRRVA